MNELYGGAGALGWVVLKAGLMFALAVVGFRVGQRRTFAELNAFDFAVAVATGADVYALLRQQEIASITDVGYLLYEARGGISLHRSGKPLGPLMRDALTLAGYDVAAAGS